MRRPSVVAMAAATGLAIAACSGPTTTQPSGPSPHRPGAVASMSPSTPATARDDEPRMFSEVVYEENPERVLSVFAPAAQGGPWPVVVMIHGAGGFAIPYDWISAVVRRGAVVFVPSWVDNGPWPSARVFRTDVADTTGQLACAVRFARARAERYGGDPSNVSLFGHSAGANLASVIAFGEPGVPKGCVVPSGSAVPDNLVLFEGDWLFMGLPSLEDRTLREDPRSMDAITPWSYLEEADRMPVHILDSDDPGLYRDAKDADRWLALRDTTGTFRRELKRRGAFEDGMVSEHEAQSLLYRHLKALGYRAAFHNLPDSSHQYLGERAEQILVDAILRV